MGCGYRGGEAVNDREKEQVVEECKQQVSGDWKSETEGHIVLVLSGWRYRGLMSLEQSDSSKIDVKGIVVARSMSPASARHGVCSHKEQGFKVGQQASLDESISLLKQSATEMNAQACAGSWRSHTALLRENHTLDRYILTCSSLLKYVTITRNKCSPSVDCSQEDRLCSLPYHYEERGQA